MRRAGFLAGAAGVGGLACAGGAEAALVGARRATLGLRSANLVKISVLLGAAFGWTGGSLAFAAGLGPAGANALSYTGTGSAAAYIIKYAQVISVVPGATYTISCWSNFTNAGAVTPAVYVAVPVTISYLGQVNAPSAGYVGRFSGTYTVPPGTTSVIVGPDTGNSVYPNGGIVYWSQLMMALGPITTYVSG